MTVALGLVCSDGVLVASDSMASNTGGHADESQKVRVMTPAPVIWTAAGSVYVIEEVGAAVAKCVLDSSSQQPLVAFTSADEATIRARLKASVFKAMRESYATALNVAPRQDGLVNLPFASDFLMLGYSNDKPWFLEFSADGQINSHTHRSFYSVGSGGPFASVARALMKHYLDGEISLELGKMVAHRAIATTIEVSSQSVGGPVQMAECTGDGARLLTREEVDNIGVQVEAWKAVERESIRQSLADVRSKAVRDLPEL